VLRALAARGVHWISEPELASRFLSGALIAVTGTNGKTTTTLLIDHLLRRGGLRSAAGGNVGGGLAPAASDLALLDDPLDWCVLEMSSFQLSGVETFDPDIGVMTNLSPDHLDRYESVEAYYGDKARLFTNADEGSRWVLPRDDEEVDRVIADTPGARYYFGGTRPSHAFVEASTLTLLLDGDPERLCDVADVPLLGRHNVRNALAAALAARLAGAKSDAIAEGLRSARALPHRLEPVAELDGVLWVNDSKATNVAATMSALESLDRPVVALLGGTDKGEDFGALAPSIAARARAVIAYGAAGPQIARSLARVAAGTVDVGLVEGDFAEVVDRAAELARAGDVVLLSPACSSFDMFESYEHRGVRFSELVRDRA
jgi:UDP-N-acetylmuramoylalanine--D-glutamate ligase